MNGKHMKYRAGFVANSSSSNFVVSLHDITAKQKYYIENHLESAELLYPGDFYTEIHDQWRISEDGDMLIGDTNMDNFDMCEFMERIGINIANVKWGY